MTVKLVLKKVLNIPALVRQMAKRGKTSEQWSAESDIDLALYAKLFKEGHLHLGYFDPIPQNIESVSLTDIKASMEAYSLLILKQLAGASAVLDVGCGNGGLLRLMQHNDISCIGVTPNTAQISEIKETLPKVPVIQKTYEDLQASDLPTKPDTIVTSESFQYIDLDKAFSQSEALLPDAGTWIICDYFRLTEDTVNDSGHRLDAFEERLKKSAFEQLEMHDITENILPCLAYVYYFATQVIVPLLDHGIDNLEIQKPAIGYLLSDSLRHYLGKLDVDNCNPDIFRKQKSYRLYVLRKTV